MAAVPFGMIAQNVQDDYASAEDIFKMSDANAGIAFNNVTNKNLASENAATLNVSDEFVSKEEILKVNDLLLADPDFDIQENMISYTKDQQTVFFSANRKLKEKKGDASNVKVKKSVQMMLFKADVKENGDWVNLEMLPFNGKRFSTGHPSLNVDDSKLYFVSDGPESTGKTDIFVVDLLNDGKYGKPENLGSKINTEGREIFPLMDDSSVLFFESDHETEGEELNVFASTIVNDEPSAPVKLDVEPDGDKAKYIAAYETIDSEAKTIAEKEADLRDLEILLESERLAEMERAEEAYKEVLGGTAYDFSKGNEVYTVQIGAFQQSVKTGTYANSSGLFNHRYDDGYNRFYSGVFESVEEANAHLEQMKKDGFEDAFVLGLKGTVRFLSE